jgi:hypothetical protein
MLGPLPCTWPTPLLQVEADYLPLYDSRHGLVGASSLAPVQALTTQPIYCWLFCTWACCSTSLSWSLIAWS